MKRFNTVFKLAYGLHDRKMEGDPLTSKNLIYVLINKQIKSLDFQNFLTWIRKQPYYVTDYRELVTKQELAHMVVLELPPVCNVAYDNFLEGNYEMMYNKEEIPVLFAGNDLAMRDAREVINRTKSAEKRYYNILVKNFGLLEKYEEGMFDGVKNLDVHPRKDEEIFNFHPEVEKGTFINGKNSLFLT